MSNLTVEQLLDELRTKISQQTYNAYADGRKEVEQERDDLQGFLDYFNAKVPDDEYGVIPHNKLDNLLKQIKDLEIIIRSENIRVNWEDKHYQEATYYTWLDDKILETDQFNLNLQVENEELIKALKFYANPFNYTHHPANSHPDCMHFVGFINESEAGELARNILTKINVIKKRETNE